MDADFSHSPSYVPQMLALIPDYEVVVGSRYTKGGRLDERWAWYRRLLSWWANSVWVRFILGTKTKDATAGFKCWQAKALENIGLEGVHSTGYIFTVEMCLSGGKVRLPCLRKSQFTLKSVTVGDSKINSGIKLEAALRVF